MLESHSYYSNPSAKVISLNVISHNVISHNMMFHFGCKKFLYCDFITQKKSCYRNLSETKT